MIDKKIIKYKQTIEKINRLITIKITDLNK